MSVFKDESSSSVSDQEMLDLADQPSFLEGQADLAMKSANSSKRGRKPLPIQWSRIIDMQDLESYTNDSFGN